MVGFDFLPTNSAPGGSSFKKWASNNFLGKNGSEKVNWSLHFIIPQSSTRSLDISHPNGSICVGIIFILSSKRILLLEKVVIIFREKNK